MRVIGRRVDGSLEMSHLVTKPTKLPLRPAKPGHPPSLISLRCLHEETLDPQLPTECTAKTDSDWSDALAICSLRWAH